MQHKFEESVLEDIKNMDQRLTELEEKIDDINTKLTQVVDAILGNPLTKTGGFINDISVLKDKIEQLEKKVVRQEDFKKRVYWIVGGGITLLLIIQYITTIYANIKR
jgi:ABC-type Fe3+-hydroxamate transport system substrate-binding protein